MSNPSDDAWGRAGDDEVLLDYSDSSDSGEEDESDKLDLSTLISQTPAAKAQSKSLYSALDQLSHEHHLKQLDLSLGEDTAIVKTNPFTKAKKQAVDRAKKASLAPNPAQIPPNTAPPRRRGNLTWAVADPDRKEPTPPPPKRASSPYRRKPKGWTNARGDAIPRSVTAPTRKKSAKGQAGGKTGGKAQDQNGEGPSKKGKTGGARGKTKDTSAITFQRLPANIPADSPLVQGFQIQRSLPLRSTKAKAAPFPMANHTATSRGIDIDQLVAGTADEARKEMVAQQAQKASQTPQRGSRAVILDDAQVPFEEYYDDPPTMTHASINSSSIANVSMDSSSVVPYSSPLGRKGDSIPLHAPQPVRARAELSHAERLEQALQSNQGLNGFQPTVTLYSSSIVPSIPPQDGGWSTIQPPKARFPPKAEYDRTRWPRSVATPLPPFKQIRASTDNRFLSPQSKASVLASKPRFKPSPPKAAHHQHAPTYALSTTHGSRAFGPAEDTSKYFRVEQPTVKTSDILPGWSGPRPDMTELEGAGAIEQSPFARRLNYGRSDNRRAGSITFANQHISSHADILGNSEATLVYPGTQVSSQHQEVTGVDHPSKRQVAGQKRQAEDDEDSEDGWGKAYPSRSYRSPTHDSTYYEPGPSSQQTLRKLPSTVSFLERFAHTPAKTPQTTQQGSGQAYSRFN